MKALLLFLTPFLLVFSVGYLTMERASAVGYDEHVAVMFNQFHERVTPNYGVFERSRTIKLATLGAPLRQLFELRGEVMRRDWYGVRIPFIVSKANAAETELYRSYF